MSSLLRIEYKDGLYLNDQSKDEYAEYLLDGDLYEVYA